MSARGWIVLGLALISVVIASWVTLGVIAEWPWPVIVVSTTPIVISFLSMLSLAPKPFFYTALVLMLYIAFAISQIMVVTEMRPLAALILGASLAYLATLKFVLQALNARRQSQRQASS